MLGKIARMLMNSMTLYPRHTSQLLVHIRKWIHVSWAEVNFLHCLSDGMSPFLSRNHSWENLSENLMPAVAHCLGSHSPSSISLLVPVPPIWQHLFMLLPKFATCYMGEKASATDRHAQRELCARERQLLLLWDSCSAFEAPFAPNEERVKAFKKFFKKINLWRFMAVFWRAPAIRREKENL